jgi:hypothetical protein
VRSQLQSRRRTFRWVIKTMGLRYIGRVAGTDHFELFERIGSIDLRMASGAERFSRLIDGLLNGVSRLRPRIRLAEGHR